MSVKDFFRRTALCTLFRPVYVRHCSQTLYESLMCCLRMYSSSGEHQWALAAKETKDKLIGSQQTDGGFDIGYRFNFGRTHNVGESTSPELRAVVSLAEYGRLIDAEEVREPITRAIRWIRRHALDLGDGRAAIPYGPYSINEVMVYNGVSFAASALGSALSLYDDEEANLLYQNMIRYLASVMREDPGIGGKFWFYSDQSRTDLDQKSRAKIDYYHQMQQVEVHAIAQQQRPVEEQLDIVREASDFVVCISGRSNVVSYANGAEYFSNRIHLWGLASVAAGLLEAAQILPQRRESYLQTASNVLDWIIVNGWNGKYFEPVLNPDGTKLASSIYMVRSDAWVVNSLAAAQKYLGNGKWTDLIPACFERIQACDFSGPESHAMNTRLVIASRLVGIVKGAFA